MAQRFTTRCVKNFPFTFPNSNFGFDVIDTWVKKDHKLAMICVNQKGEEKKYCFLDLSNLSNKATTILLKFIKTKVTGFLPCSPGRIRGMNVKAFIVLNRGMNLRNP